MIAGGSAGVRDLAGSAMPTLKWAFYTGTR
jgi:hypothetical protein